MTKTGMLYVFEGADGVGKSTLADWFAQHLQSAGRACTLLSFPGKEAGSLGRHIYELHHDPSRFGIERLSAASIQALHVAAHIDTIETRIKPLLASGDTVVLDRFWWSTVVYGATAGVPRSLLDGMVAVERSAWEPVDPDCLFLITRRLSLRAEPPGLWSQWRDAYLELAKEEHTKYSVTVIPNEALDEAQQLILTHL